MYDRYTWYLRKRIEPVELETEQRLLFSTSVQSVNKIGRVSSVTWEREVQIMHTQRARELYKFQIFLLNSDIVLKRKPEPKRDFLKKMMYLFDEVVVWVDTHGTITGVHNFPFLQYQWKQLKTELMWEYHTPEFTPYYEQTDMMLQDQSLLVDYLNLPGVYGLYFNGYWREYRNLRPMYQTIRFGDEADNIEIKEEVDFKLLHEEGRQLSKLIIHGEPADANEWESYSGEYLYNDEILESCYKQVDFGNKKTIYTAKWIGKKKIFQ